MDTGLILGLSATASTIISTIVTGIVAVLVAKLNTKADQAAEKVEVVALQAETAAVAVIDVKRTLKDSTTNVDDKLNKLKKVADSTHTLVNSNMGIQLKLNAALTQRIAEYTNDPEDVKTAELSKLLYQAHMEKQAIVDSSA